MTPGASVSDSTKEGVRIAAVGDLMLGDSAICTGFGFASRYSESRFEAAMSAKRMLFADADIVFGNLECSLSQHGHEPRQRTSTNLRGRPGYVEGLTAAGVNVVSVANNHASQHGKRAFAETVAMLRQSGVASCGVRGEYPWSSAPAIMEKNGMRLGFLGYCLRPRQYSPATPPYAEGNAAAIAGDVERLSKAVDHVLVSLHWGEEYVAWPSAEEVLLAEGIIDTGAVAVLGHHPHVPRPVQRYRHGVIAYSLGNFASDMIWYPPLRESILLTFELTNEIERVAVRQLHIDRDLLPAPVEPPHAEAVATRVTGLSEAEYRAEVSRTVRAGRWAGYRYAASNAHRFRSPTFRQLLTTTARNKMAALLGQSGFAS
jgi:gamma-polyglutamate biosynthesis protein CapA